jgi:hypothetical protein
MKNFFDLTDREVLAVAISSEEEDGRSYMSFTEDLKERYPDGYAIPASGLLGRPRRRDRARRRHRDRCLLR